MSYRTHGYNITRCDGPKKKEKKKRERERERVTERKRRRSNVIVIDSMVYWIYQLLEIRFL